MRLPKPFPPKVDVNPDNAKVRSVGEPPDTSEAHHKAVEAVARAQHRVRLMEAARMARKQGKLLRAASLEAELAAMGEP